MFFAREAYQAKQNAAFETLRVPAPPTALPPKPSPSPLIAAGTVLGRISIPRLKIRAIVDEGVDDDTLSRAVGHVPGTAYPGQPGNIAVAGHRDTFFRQLRHLRKYDEIDLEAHNRKFRYRVDSMKVVEPSETEVLAPTANNVLTLVTCFPFSYIGNAPHRFIVQATQIGE